MGAYLDAPITEKNPVHGQNSMVAWGACGMQGWRCGMEDAHICEEVSLPNGEKGQLFCVFDGHGGKDVAEFAEKNFVSIFTGQNDFKNSRFDIALELAFMDLDKKVSEEDYATDTGSTACVVFVTKENIYCANAGDSRAVLCRKGAVVELSEDHKPDNELEEKRIQAANHFVSDQRVDGNLALSRAFGDFQYKDMPSLQPQN